MKILGIDTTTKYLCLGLYLDGKVCEYNLEAGRKLSGLLTEHIRRALKAQGLKISDIDYFAAGLGPGSFTGMRLGLATIKGLSFIKNRPVIGISTLDILAANVKEKNRLIIPVVDAKRGLLYCASYVNCDTGLKRQSAYALYSLEEFLDKFSSPAFILGDGLSLYADKLRARMKNIAFLDKDYWFPKARNLIELALPRIRDKDFSDTFKIKPIYLYSKECQMKKR